MRYIVYGPEDPACVQHFLVLVGLARNRKLLSPRGVAERPVEEWNYQFENFYLVELNDLWIYCNPQVTPQSFCQIPNWAWLLCLSRVCIDMHTSLLAVSREQDQKWRTSCALIHAALVLFALFANVRGEERFCVLSVWTCFSASSFCPWGFYDAFAQVHARCSPPVSP